MKEFILKLLLAGLAVLAPIKAVMIATIVVILIDLVTGLWRASTSKETISSSVMRRTITKLLVYQFAIIAGFIIETFLVSGVPITKLVSSVIGMVEIKSILENLDEVYGGSIFKSLLRKLGSDNDKPPTA